MNYHYIVVEGSIGSEKTLLSKKLAQYFEANLITEATDKNPFLLPFYLNTTQHSLAAQLYFLLERSESMKLILDEEKHSNNIIVTDFILEKDQIFAPIILETDELNLYWKLRSKIMPEFIIPDLVIYLQCSDEKNNKNIQERGKSALEIFPPGYLQQVHDGYRHFFHLYENAPLLIVNIDEVDFNNEDHFELLIRTMQNIKGQRHYLNCEI